MSFKKLNPPIKEALEHLGYKEPLPFQKEVIPKIKSGVNLIGIGPEGCGKTAAMIIGTIQKLEGQAFEDAPRALIFVKDKEAALSLEDRFREFTNRTDLRIYSAYDAPDIETQKNAIYDGVDIVIGTPGKIKRIFQISGINLGQMKLVIIDDAEFIVSSRSFKDLISIPDHIGKCQYLLFATKTNSKVEKIKELFMSPCEVVLHN